MSFTARLFLFCILLFPLNLLAQDEFPAPCPKIENKKALKLFKKAEDLYNSNSTLNNAGARELLKQALEEEPNFAEAYLFMATLTRRREEFKAMAEAYEKAIEICPGYDAESYYQLGIYYFSEAYTDFQKYEKAVSYFKNYLKFEKTPDKKHNEAERLIKSGTFYAKLLKNPVPFAPIPLTDISGPLDEYLPCISADHTEFYFTRRGLFKIPKLGIAGSDKEVFLERFVKSELKPDGKYTEGKSLPYPFNESDNQGGASLSIDNSIMYFTTCKQNAKGYLNCDIFFCENKNGTWGEIQSAGANVNGEDTWESQPCLSSDGQTLYFSSIRKTNIGFNEKDNTTCDIYKSIKNKRGLWGPAINLGNTINTRGDEKSPFMHSDSKTMYFTSNGHMGVGGFDIYMTKEKNDSSWEKPKNIGYPINSENDDLGFIVSTDGKTAYFASDKLKGKGGYDIYSFELYKDARPEKVVFLKGTVKNDQGESLNANIQIKNIKTNKITKIPVDSVTGKYASIVRLDGDLVLSIKKPGNAFSSEYISQKDTNSTALVRKMDFSLKPIVVGSSYTIKNINYSTNSAELMPESKFVLDDFIEYLNENPNLKIAINGHTDNMGNDKDNLSLSHDRAFTVYDYLLSKGINKTRLDFHGYGKTKPIVTNDTEEGRARNRRTEFLIISK
jgi:outer membrane protein OmpA-like peptidoglycan-associated protein